MEPATVDSEGLYRLLADELRGFVRARVEPAVVDDLVQEVFLRVHRSGDQLRDSERVAAWVYRITRNVIADHHRRPTLDTTALDGHERVDDHGIDEALAESDPRRLALWLRAAIEGLPPIYREALTLVEIEGLDTGEAARRLDISTSGMKSRLTRGRALLRRALDRCCAVELDHAGRLVDYRARKRPTCCP
ncbi:MAG: sigma-70 family RNA polymerase sigma factor [Nannocystaceae bacterium]|nr:sigma-70 family RNA polymerase sigma factor [Myxococcales bacterium]